MCGFVAWLHEQIHNKNILSVFGKMNNMIEHRGPDDFGYYADEHVYLGFRRLSIIDLENGKQPLSYDNERYWVIFNGEIYNYIELRNGLEETGYRFQTNSDTEVIAALYCAMKEKMFEKLRGMYAFLIWDSHEQILFGARDPFGIKPFYYLEKTNEILFASELKSLQASMKSFRLNEDSLQHLLTFQYPPEPDTMFRNIRKLKPGHFFIKKLGEPMKIFSYWEPSFHPVKLSEDTFVKEIREALFESVEIHMRSDVPVGAFLSSGIDSTIIAAIAKENNSNIKTFTVGFEREGFNEIKVAKETASMLNIENISYTISPEDVINELPKIIWHLDEPVADPSVIPLYFLSREARKQVTAVLSGEGADELFGGYNIYREPISLKVFDYLPVQVKKLLKTIANTLPEGIKGKGFIERGTSLLEERYVGNAKIFTEREKKQLYKKYQDALDYRQVTSPLYKIVIDADPVQKMQYIDLNTWLRGDILLKADKMTMAHSLELRVPFLDQRVFEIATKIPSCMKITKGTTKYILRKAFDDIIPRPVLHRKKLGFPVPIRHWLRDEMYDWAVNIINQSQTDDLFNKTMILQLLENHYKGVNDYSRKIWTILVFMIWHQVFVEKRFEFDTNTLYQKNNQHVSYKDFIKSEQLSSSY
jgi:asparagine synthase (glutamine-hydrolysing)